MCYDRLLTAYYQTGLYVVVYCCVWIEYQEEVKRLPIKFENPTFEGGKKGHQLYGQNWQQHINDLLRQRYGHMTAIQADSTQQQQQQSSSQQSGRGGQVKEVRSKSEGGKAGGQQKVEEKSSEKGKESETAAPKPGN